MFGVGGGLVGFGIGAAAQWLDETNADGKSILAMGGIGALSGAILGQLTGMMIVNRQRGGTGLLMTPILGAGGAATMMGYSKFYRKHSEVKTVMKYGLVGLLVGAPIGGGVDYLRKNLGA